MEQASLCFSPEYDFLGESVCNPVGKLSHAIVLPFFSFYTYNFVFSWCRGVSSGSVCMYKSLVFFANEAFSDTLYSAWPVLSVRLSPEFLSSSIPPSFRLQFSWIFLSLTQFGFLVWNCLCHFIQPCVCVAMDIARVFISIIFKFIQLFLVSLNILWAFLSFSLPCVFRNILMFGKYTFSSF